MAKGWIKKAVPKDRRGVFAAKAAAAGKSTSRYATEKAHATGQLGQEARLAKTLMHMSHKPSEHRYRERA
jgi:hypothetical protein